MDVTVGTAKATDVEMGDLSTPIPVKQYLELVMAGDLYEFQAEMVKFPLNITAGPSIYEDRTSLHLAALHEQVEIAKHILASSDISTEVVNARDHFGYTPLHLAVRSEHVDVVRILTASSLTSRFLAATSERDERGGDCDGFSPLHIAATVGNVDIVKLLLQQACDQDRPVNIHATTWQGMTASDIAKTKNHVKLVDVLECYDVNWLQLERQKSANSVNAILVGAALVATVTFGCLLQPPLRIPDHDDSSTGTAAGPDASRINGNDVKIQYISGQIGWFLLITAFSFACSVVSLVIGTTAIIPSNGASLKKEVQQLRRSVLRASIFLFLAIFFLVLASQVGSLVVFPMVYEINTVIKLVGYYVRMALPTIILAFVLRYIVLPKGTLKLKKWVRIMFFIVALGLNFGIYLAIIYCLRL